jgi:hypothetical protein
MRFTVQICVPSVSFVFPGDTEKAEEKETTFIDLLLENGIPGNNASNNNIISGCNP